MEVSLGMFAGFFFSAILFISCADMRSKELKPCRTACYPVQIHTCNDDFVECADKRILKLHNK